MATKDYLTQQKYDELKEELADLLNVKRKEVAEDLEYAKSLGDLSENAEYHEAREKQAKVEDRIASIEQVLKNAIIVKATNGGSVVEVGSSVTVQKEGQEESRQFTIVGSEETDTSSGKISFHSPLGSAVLGKKKGDDVSVKAPNGIVKYKIISVN
jgi:transcription elongation factor GreA